MEQNNDRLLKMATTAACAKAGTGWRLLGADLRKALVAYEALAIIGQNGDNPGYEKAAVLATAVMQGSF
jgi:hypothetical protein